MSGRIVRYILFLLAFAAVAYAWGAYDSIRDLSLIFKREFGNVVPIYATRSPIDLDDQSVKLRLIVAIGITTFCILLSLIATIRRWPVWVCLLIALPSVVAINSSVAHIRSGRDGFVEPYRRSGLEYFADVSRVNDSPGMFIRTYASISPTLSLHAGTHPPGGVLFLWAGSKLFGGSLDAAAWLTTCFGALGILPTYWLARQLIGSVRARRILPLYLVTPSLVIFGSTSMDIVFCAFGVSALAAMFWAMKRFSMMRILLAGALFWLAAFMTFSVIALPVLAGCYALAAMPRRRAESIRMLGRLFLVGLAFISFQFLAHLVVDYDFALVADAAMKRDFLGVGVTGYETFRLWRAYSVANLMAFLFGSGIAISAAAIVALITSFGRPLLNRPRAWIALALPAALIAISASTLFTLETERVWLALAPAMLCVTVSLRGWMIWLLAISLSFAQVILTECSLNTHW